MSHEELLSSEIPVGIHYEAEISFINKDGEIFVKKTYRDDVECIQWLNHHLEQYYDAEKGLPVAQHEFKALELLSRYDISAQPVKLERAAIIMKFCGIPFEMKHAISRKSYANQCLGILSILSELKFSHNDLLPSNLLIDGNNKLRVIDFTLSEFANIRIMKHLPNQKWARAYRDRDVLEFYSPKKRLKFCLKRVLGGF